MRRATAILAALVLASGASAQDGKDRIGKDKAPVTASKMLAENAKRKSAAIAELNYFGEQIAQPASTFEGVLRKDFAAVKGTAEAYARGSTYLFSTGARFDPPEALEGPEGSLALQFRNPALFLQELAKVIPSAQFGGDASVDGKDCVVIDFLASPPLIKQYLKEIADRLGSSMRGANGGGFGGFVGGRGSLINVANALDEKGSVATFHASVGKADLNLYKLDFVIRPKIKQGALPEQVRLPPLDQKTEIKFSKWDEDVAFDIAPFVKAKWGIR